MASVGYILCEYDSIKEEFGEFADVRDALHSSMIASANADWAPKTHGGFKPTGDKQYGETTILPAIMRDINNVRLSTWRQTFGAAQTGAQTIMSGVNGGLIPRDYKMGFLGLAFLSKCIRITEIRWQVSETKGPRVNIEEVMSYNKPAIVLEHGMELDENEGFDLYAFVECPGQTEIMPLGMQLNKIPNKTQVTNCGAAI